MSNSRNIGKATAGSDKKEDLSILSDRNYIPHLPSDPPVSSRPWSLAEFREREGKENRKRKLQQLWRSLPDVLHEPHNRSQIHGDAGDLTPEKAESLQKVYDRELLNLCSTNLSGSQTRPHIGWKEFKEFAEKKEAGMFRLKASFEPSFTAH